MVLGEMAEWLNAPVLKTGILKGIWGSNPSLTAINLENTNMFRIFTDNYEYYGRIQ